MMSVNKKLTTLVIGDIHFKSDTVSDGAKFVNNIIEIAEKEDPSFIVLLGDILDTHEIVNVQPYKIATLLIEELSKIAPLYIIIGNHDLINHTQFLTDNHAFNPFKRWDNVFVADKPLLHTFKDSEGYDKVFTFCPYVQPGRFIEALKHEHEEEWESSYAIFAHQEFKGCSMNKITSNQGDVWDEELPPVISGHIHDEQIVGDNIFYTGSSIQNSYSESPNKKVWLINWEPPIGEDIYYENGFSVKKIKVGMRPKYLKNFTIDELLDKSKTDAFINSLKTSDIKIKLSGSSQEFKVFRTSEIYKLITNNKFNVKFSYNLVEDNPQSDSVIERLQREDLSFRKIFKDLVVEQSNSVKGEYNELFDNEL